MERDRETSPDAQLAQTATEPTSLEHSTSAGQKSKEAAKAAVDPGDRLQLLPVELDENAVACAMEAEMAALQMHLAVVSSAARETELDGTNHGDVHEQPEGQTSVLQGPLVDAHSAGTCSPEEGGVACPPTAIEAVMDRASVLDASVLEASDVVEGRETDAQLSVVGKGPSAPKQQGKMLEKVLETLMQELGLTRTLDTFRQEWQASSPRRKDKSTDTSSHRRSSSTSSSASESSCSGGVSQEPASTAAAAVVADPLPPAVGVLLRKLLHEREMLSIHYRQAVQERERVAKDTKALRRRYSEYEPLIAELRSKYDMVLREKTLVGIQRDRLAEQLRKVNLMQESGQQQVLTGSPTVGQQQQETVKVKSLPSSPAASRPPWRPAAAVSDPSGQNAAPARLAPPASLPVDAWQNPYDGLVFEQTPAQSFTVQRTLASHSQPVTSLAMHPSKPLGVSTCKDGSWSMWHVETGDLVMTGRCHKGSITCAQFHPKGTSLATASEDGTIQLWSFDKQKLTATLGGPDAAPVTSLAFHDTGSFLASGSAGGAAHLWDLTTCKGHTGAITGVAWQPWTNMLATCSADATVCLWDARNGLCCQTLSGHGALCTSVAFSLKGDRLATADAAGAVLVWDTRTWRLQTTVPTGAAVNECVFDTSGQLLLAATQSGEVRCFDSTSGTSVASFDAQAGPLEAVATDCSGQHLIAAGNDGSVKAWQCA